MRKQRLFYIFLKERQFSSSPNKLIQIIISVLFSISLLLSLPQMRVPKRPFISLQRNEFDPNGHLFFFREIPNNETQNFEN